MPQCADPNAELLSAAEAGDAGAAALLLYVLDCPGGLDVNHRQGCQMAKFDPFLSLDCARVEGVGAQSKERKGSNFAA